MTDSALARTPLYDLIQAQNARLVDFSGWEMPVQFAGLKAEHAAVRNAVGMFDVSHMGKFRLHGKGLNAALQTLVPTDLSSLTVGQAKYTVLLNSEGGIIDDFIFYCQGKEQGFAIVNAGTKEKDKAWMQEKLAAAGIELEDVSEEKVLLAVQGPEAIATLQPFVEGELAALKAFEHVEAKVFGETAAIARTGYTGEDGVEMMLPPEAGRKLWRSLLEAGVVPCGLGARDTLRLEAAMALYGQDIDEKTTPLEAGLGWLVNLDRVGEFVGRQALEAQKQAGVSRRLVGLEMGGRHIARHGYPVRSQGETVGEVTSGTLAPTVEKAIALAYVPTALAKPGQAIEVEIRGKLYPATVVKKPFYRSEKPAPK